MLNDAPIINGIIMSKKRDTFVYELKDGRTIVYFGISNGPLDRETEHLSSNKKFTHMRVIRGPMFKENALKLEGMLIQRYQSQHNGRPPKYNKNKIY